MRVYSVILAAAASLGVVQGWTSSRLSPLRMVATEQQLSNSVPTEKTSRTGHDLEAWKAAYTTCPKEIPPTVLDFKDLPADFPVGSYYRNGHGRFESDDGVRCQHMFDGDGMVTAITFEPQKNKVLFRNRFIRTAGYVQDKETGTMSMPGTFGTKVSGGFLKNMFRTDFKNVANTHVLYSEDGSLYALWEAGWPYKLDPRTLENDVVNEPRGNNLKGLLKEGDYFAAHYRYDPTSDHYVNFATKLNPAAGTTKISLYELDSSLNSIRRDEDVSVQFQGTGLIHDYALTENWHIFSIPPASINNVNALQALLGLKSFASVVDFKADCDSTLLLLVPRMKDLAPGTASNMNVDTDKRIKVVRVPYHFSFHSANAFDEENGNVVVDMVLMNEAVTGADMSRDQPVWEAVDWDNDVYPPNYVRFTLDPIAETMVSRPKVISTRAPEFPMVPKQLSTRKHRFAYTVGAHKEFEVDPTTGRGSGPAGAILKLDAENPENNEAFSFAPHEFVGEPCFVPKVGADVTQDEDKGYLVLFTVNGIDLTSDLVIFDVEGSGSLEAGPVARMRLPTYIPHGLHGTFIEGLTFDV